MTRSLRALGALPLVFEALHAAHCLRAGSPGNMLWPCHVAGVMLGVGLLAAKPALVRVAVPWVVAGLLPWAYDMAVTGERAPTSMLAHLGGSAVGLAALRRLGAEPMAWAAGTGLWILLQALARFTTDPAANVNLAHRIYPGWEGVFGSLRSYQVAVAFLVAGCLAVTSSVLARCCPPVAGGREERDDLPELRAQAA